MFWEGLSLLRDKVGGEHLSGRPGCLLGGWGARFSPCLCPPRLCKEWIQVPSPEQFFQPLYVSHSGDFRVSALPPGQAPRNLSSPGGVRAPGVGPEPPGPQPGLGCRTCKVQEIIPVGQTGCKNNMTPGGISRPGSPAGPQAGLLGLLSGALDREVDGERVLGSLWPYLQNTRISR